MNWEIGIDIYTVICIKQITNKNLLYKKINKIKFKKKRAPDPQTKFLYINSIIFTDFYYEAQAVGVQVGT